MQIIDENIENVSIYNITPQKKQRKILYKPISEFFSSFANKQPLSTLSEKVRIFLDERSFQFFCFNIKLTAKKPFSIQNMRKIIDKKIQYIKKTEQFSSPYIIHKITHIYINKQPSLFVLGQEGEIHFSLYLYLLQKEGVTTCALLGGKKVFSHPLIDIYPRNFFLIPKLSQQTQKQNYAFLRISKQQTELIIVKNMNYKAIHYLNMGTNTLKECYKEQNIEKFFYTNHNEIKNNPLLSKLVDEAISFFANNLSQRLQKYLLPTDDVIITGKVLSIPSFLPIFQNAYFIFSNSYIIPFVFNKKSEQDINVPHISAYLETLNSI